MKSSPIRTALSAGSSLLRHVRDGAGGIKRQHRARLDDAARKVVRDSLDLDAALRAEHPQDPRWDYLIGITGRNALVAIEMHSAKDDQIGRIEAKRTAARSQLAARLRPGATVGKWLWLASSRNQFANTERVRRRLDQAGITFVARELRASDL